MSDATKPDLSENVDVLHTKLGDMTLQSGLTKDADGFFTAPPAAPAAPAAPKADSEPGE
jgi:hypothetical protein